MRIAILSPSYPYRGGIAQFTDRYFTELSLIHEVQIFSYTTLYPQLLFPGKTQYVPDVDEKQDKSIRLLSSVNPLSFAKTSRQINQFAPDIVIVAYWMPYMAVALGSVCRLLDKKIKVVGLVHNALPHEKSFLDKPLANYFFNSCDAFITMSQSVADDLKQLLLPASKPILALEHPIYDHYGDRISQQLAKEHLKISQEKKTLLFFGLIRDYKGLDILIESMNQLDDTYQLLVAGECYGDFTKYQSLIEKNTNQNNIHIHERYIADDEVKYFFSAADVLVLPYRSGTQSGVSAIAYQLSLPMIASNVGGIGSAVQQSGTGMVLEEISPKHLAKGIKDFFRENKDYKASLKNEKTRLSWSSFNQSAELFLKSIL